MSMLTKSNLYQKLAKDNGLTAVTARKVLNDALGTIKDSLSQGKTVRLTGFGTFMVSHRKARTGRNPQTGKPLRIPAQNTPRFRTGKGLKDAVNK